jgi:pimeloyl-ACP methyl ester carboxylesterase
MSPRRFSNCAQKLTRTGEPRAKTVAEVKTEVKAMTRVQPTLSRRQKLAVPVRIPADSVTLDGDLSLPPDASGLVLFAHGSGSSRHSPRNQFVATTLQESGCATLLFDLLTTKEEAEDAYSGHLRFDIGLLASRLVLATKWCRRNPATRNFPVAYFGSSTGAAAALEAAAAMGEAITAVVSRGGRPDLAMESLPQVGAATLFIAGEQDHVVLRLNEQAYARLRCKKDFAIVPRATHLFEEPGALEEVARLAARWFQTQFKAAASRAG